MFIDSTILRVVLAHVMISGDVAYLSNLSWSLLLVFDIEEACSSLLKLCYFIQVCFCTDSFFSYYLHLNPHPQSHGLQNK